MLKAMVPVHSYLVFRYALNFLEDTINNVCKALLTCLEALWIKISRFYLTEQNFYRGYIVRVWSKDHIWNPKLL